MDFVEPRKWVTDDDKKNSARLSLVDATDVRPEIQANRIVAA